MYKLVTQLLQRMFCRDLTFAFITKRIGSLFDLFWRHCEHLVKNGMVAYTCACMNLHTCTCAHVELDIFRFHQSDKKAT